MKALGRFVNDFSRFWLMSSDRRLDQASPHWAKACVRHAARPSNSLPPSDASAALVSQRRRTSQAGEKKRFFLLDGRQAQAEALDIDDSKSLVRKAAERVAHLLSSAIF
jgi:hypothetical protein